MDVCFSALCHDIGKLLSSRIDASLVVIYLGVGLGIKLSRLEID